MNIDLLFPLAGYDERYAYAQQPPYTSFLMQNVWPIDAYEGRERGGTRPGLCDYIYGAFGSGNEIKMMAQLDWVMDIKKRSVTDTFDGTSLSGNWGEAEWLSDKPSIIEHRQDTVSTSVNSVATTRAAVTLDNTSVFTINQYIVPFEGQHHGKYQIFFGMDNSAPDYTQDGLAAELVLTTAGAYSGTLKQYSGGALTDTWNFSGGSTGYVTEGLFQVYNHSTVGNNAVTVRWLGNTLINNQDLGETYKGDRYGFGMEATNAGGRCLTKFIRLEYSEANDNYPDGLKNSICLVSNNTLYADEGEATPAYSSDLSTENALTLSGNSIQSVSYNGKLYIADYGQIRLESTTGSIASGGQTLTDANIADFTAHDIDITRDVVVISGAQDARNRAYKISNLAAGTITLDVSADAFGVSTCTYRIEPGPKKYTPGGAIEFWLGTNGKIPVGCKVITKYRDSIMLTGDQNNPHMWYLSGQTRTDTDGTLIDGAEDWTDSLDLSDVGRSVSGTSADLAGQIGEPITAAMQYSDDYLILGCENKTKRMNGDARIGGTFVTVNENVGFIDKKGWCWGPNKEVYFMSKKGICLIEPGYNGAVRPVSEIRMPREMINLDSSTTVSMAYSYKWHGILIFLTQGSDKGIKHWWYDLKNKSFFPMKFDGTDHEPTAILEYTCELSEQSDILLGCRDGVIRRLSMDMETDNGTEIDSYVTYGPLGDKAYSTQIQALIGEIGTGSGDIAAELLIGDSAQDLKGATAYSIGTW